MDLHELADKIGNNELERLLKQARNFEKMHNAKSRINSSMKKGKVLRYYEEHLSYCNSANMPVSRDNKFNMLFEFQEQIKFAEIC